jgi:hypothetical protein
MKEWLEDRETKWHNLYRTNVLWEACIPAMTVEVLANATVGKAAPTQEGRKDKRNGSARQDSEDLGASQHAGAMQGSKPKKHQQQQQ